MTPTPPHRASACAAPLCCWPSDLSTFADVQSEGLIRQVAHLRDALAEVDAFRR